MAARSVDAETKSASPSSNTVIVSVQHFRARRRPVFGRGRPSRYRHAAARFGSASGRPAFRGGLGNCCGDD
ncbi:hypothetical protein KCP73_08425 [Salmonella enterica subsp. enterica]|nr:hypothetical protein KCP73_08425 [Salmonella enterica subsp. enterica]